MRRRSLFYPLFFLGAIFFIYRQWFLNPEIIGGDWPYYHEEFLQEFSLIPSLWAPWQGNGIGGINPLLGLQMFSSALIVPFVLWFKIPWTIVYKIGWFGLFLALSFMSIRTLLKKVLPNYDGLFLSIGSLVYMSNTYILMLVSGGQMGVALAYSIAPLVLTRFINLVNLLIFSSADKLRIKNEKLKITVKNSKLVKSSVVAGLVLSLQAMWDPRITYITAITLMVYVLMSFCLSGFRAIKSILPATILSGLVALLLSSFWVLPMVMVFVEMGIEQLGADITSSGMVEFLSFAQLENTISLLHPNWPENIFGKVYFMRWEFLLIPILAYSSLLFINEKLKIKNEKRQIKIKNFKSNITMKQYNNKAILYFALLALIGAFLAKGGNEPFGGVYIWLFENVPGFIMFRDPTKFYLLAILSYTVLIPYGLSGLARWINEKLKIKNEKRQIKIKNLITLSFLAYWLFLIKPAWVGELGGTFKKHEVPEEYSHLKTLLKAQPKISRTLWVPRLQRFAYSTIDHMSVEVEPLFSATNPAELKRQLNTPSASEFLSDLGVQYVVVLHDSLGELFLKDRKYDKMQRQQWEEVLDSIAWLRKIQEGSIAVYETASQKDKFWLSTNNLVSYKRFGQGRYALSFSVSEPSELNFSENYHPGWIFISDKARFSSEKAEYGLNKFIIDMPGRYSGIISFAPQKYVDLGAVISLITLAVIVYALCTFKRMTISV